MDILFTLIWFWIFFNLQLAFRIPVPGGHLEFGFIIIMVIYAGFTFSFIRGLIAVILITFMAETYTMVPHGFLIVVNLILFIGIHVLLDQILSEAYLSKALWVGCFSFVGQLIAGFVFDSDGSFILHGAFWGLTFIQSVFNALLSLPLFLLLDYTLDLWTILFSRRRAHLTGADFYQVQSKQRKYF